VFNFLKIKYLMENVLLGLAETVITFSLKTISSGKNKNCTDSDGKVGKAS
jgi:hypothetical protein